MYNSEEVSTGRVEMSVRSDVFPKCCSKCESKVYKMVLRPAVLYYLEKAPLIPTGGAAGGGRSEDVKEGRRLRFFEHPEQG